MYIKKLKEKILPALLATRPMGGTIRAWTPGCSTGEEAYSLAIVFKEVLGIVKPAGNFLLQVFATDLDKDAVDKARTGVYPANIAADVSPDRLRRFFIKEGDGDRVCKEIREMLTFATQNLIMHPPFTKLDILICRNLLIYLAPELQKKLLPLFHYSLNRGGILFLGSAESVSTFTNLFEAVNIQARLFRQREFILSAETRVFPASFVTTRAGVSKELTMSKPAVNLQSLADQLLLQHFSPPAVLVDDKGDILYLSGRTGKYLEPAAGKANWNIFAMAREGLRYDLGIAFRKAIRQKEAIKVKGLKVGSNGGTLIVTEAFWSIVFSPAGKKIDLRDPSSFRFRFEMGHVKNRRARGTRTVDTRDAEPVLYDRFVVKDPSPHGGEQSDTIAVRQTLLAELGRWAKVSGKPISIGQRVGELFGNDWRVLESLRKRGIISWEHA